MADKTVYFVHGFSRLRNIAHEARLRLQRASFVSESLAVVDADSTPDVPAAMRYLRRQGYHCLYLANAANCNAAYRGMEESVLLVHSDDDLRRLLIEARKRSVSCGRGQAPDAPPALFSRRQRQCYERMRRQYARRPGALKESGAWSAEAGGLSASGDVQNDSAVIRDVSTEVDDLDKLWAILSDIADETGLTKFTLASGAADKMGDAMDGLVEDGDLQPVEGEVDCYEFANVVEEGVFDPYIMKCVFVVGSGGSGKSFIAGKAFGGTGLRTINSDDALEVLADLKRINLRTDLLSPEVQRPGGLRDRAKKITANKQWASMQGRMGMVIDGTGANVSKVLWLKFELEKLGYDTACLLVNTTKDVALANNAKRSRVVDPAIVSSDWEVVQKARMQYQQMFGPQYYEVENDEPLTPQQITADLVPRLTRLSMRFLNAPLRNPVGLAWIENAIGGNPELRKLVHTPLPPDPNTRGALAMSKQQSAEVHAA